MKPKTWSAIGATCGSRAFVIGMSLATNSGIAMCWSMPVPGQWIHLRFLPARKTSREGQP